MHVSHVTLRPGLAALSKPEPISLILARVFDRLADAELQHGHHGAAERLSIRASELREAAQ